SQRFQVAPSDLPAMAARLLDSLLNLAQARSMSFSAHEATNRFCAKVGDKGVSYAINPLLTSAPQVADQRERLWTNARKAHFPLGVNHRNRSSEKSRAAQVRF